MNFGTLRIMIFRSILMLFRFIVFSCSHHFTRSCFHNICLSIRLSLSAEAPVTQQFCYLSSLPQHFSRCLGCSFISYISRHFFPPCNTSCYLHLYKPPSPSQASVVGTLLRGTARILLYKSLFLLYHAPL